jgi:hypothetical protein
MGITQEIGFARLAEEDAELGAAIREVLRHKMEINAGICSALQHGRPVTAQNTALAIESLHRHVIDLDKIAEDFLFREPPPRWRLRLRAPRT